MTEFNHEDWVKTLVDQGFMTPEGEKTYTPGEEHADPPAEPDFATESVENGGIDNAVENDLAEEVAAEGVELKYLGHGAYEANGVEVKRNGQTVSVDEDNAQALTELRDDDGNTLFERV